MIKRVLGIVQSKTYSFFYKIYIIGKQKDEAFKLKNRNYELNSSAIIGENVQITDEVVIQNSVNDRTKIVIGASCFIRGHLLVYKHGGQIQIGDYCFIGASSKIWSAKNIIIGNRVLISHNVNIHDNNSHSLNSDERHKDFMHILNKGLQENVDYKESEIIIEDDVWIGFNSTILKGVRIGKGAIIGAQTLITQDVPAFAVVVGNPARIIKFTD